MTDVRLPIGPADLHYTALITLLWQLYERAQELGLPTRVTDLVVASNELRNGPGTTSATLQGDSFCRSPRHVSSSTTCSTSCKPPAPDSPPEPQSSSPDRSSTGTVIATIPNAISKPRH